MDSSGLKTVEGKSVAVGGGIGDFFVFDSFWDQKPSQIIWNNRARLDCQELYELLFPEITHIRTNTHDERYSPTRPETVPEGSEDWSVMLRFPMLAQGKYKYVGSSFLKHQVADVSQFDIPPNSVLIQADTPFNDEATRKARQLSDDDWDHLLKRLEREKRYGIVVDCDRAKAPPDHKRIINYVGQTTLGESIELLKKCVGYYGNDSCLACLACQKFQAKDLLIKCFGFHYLCWKRLYCAPHKEWLFLFEHYNPQPYKPKPKKVVEIPGNDPVEVLLLVPRVMGTGVVLPNTVVKVPADVARIWCNNDVAVCWQQRKEENLDQVRKLQKILDPHDTLRNDFIVGNSDLLPVLTN